MVSRSKKKKNRLSRKKINNRKKTNNRRKTNRRKTNNRKKTKKISKNKKNKNKNKQKGGTVGKHIMYRFLSEEDRLALNILESNSGFETEIMNIKLSSNEDDKDTIFDSNLIRSSFKQHPIISQLINDIKAEIRSENIPMSKKKQKLQHRLNVLESEYLDNVSFSINVNVKKSFYPIDNVGLSMID